jgi:GTPase Era involved in 16S rRNA processing
VIPTFAVVGHVNKGKSSIVSTLTEDDSVRIEKGPGTTRVCREFPIVVDGRTLFSLVDTPGFEQARAVLDWLQQHEERYPTHREVVQAFLDAHRQSDAFSEECQLLAPVMAGAGILYVVDGSLPFRRQYRAEMEILRWTGQPRMALINQISERDHIETWRVELDQYFSIVRTFDAHVVGFPERIRLLRGMRELSEQFRAPLDEAIPALIQERRRRRHEAARVVARLVSGATSFVLKETIPRDDAIEPHGDALQRRFHDARRRLEGEARGAVEELYLHSKLVRDETELEAPTWGMDLFARESFKMLGLRPGQLVVASTAAGATIGGGLDAAVGGASFGTGLLLGALTGGMGAAYYSVQNLASVRTMWTGFRGDRVLAIGPHKNPNFPWVVLDRALLHWSTVSARAHARRDPITLDSKDRQGIVSLLSDDLRKSLTRVFTSIRKKAPRVSADLDQQLLARIQDALDQLAADEERVSSST